MAEPTNKPKEIIDNIVKQIIFDIGVKMAIADMVASAPFLGWPIIGGIFTFFVNMLAGKIFKGVSTFIDFQVIKFENEKQRADYEAALSALKTATKSGDTNEINKSLEDVKSKLDKLIHFGN